MAFVYDPLEREQDKKTLEGGTPQPSGEPGGTLAGQGGEGGAPQTSPQTSSGNFVNLQKYLDANASKIPGFAEKIATDIGTRGQQGLAQENQAGSSFNQRVTEGTPSSDTSIFTEAAANPVSVMNDPTKLAQFRAQQGAEYKGPLSWDTSAEAAQAGTVPTEFQKYSSPWDTEAGRVEAVKKYQNPSNITQGKATLDALLLQNTPTGQQNAFSKTIKPAFESNQKSLDDRLAEIAQEQNKAVSDAAQGAQNVQDTYQSTFFGDQGLIPTLQKQYEQRATDLYNKLLAQGQAAGTLTPPSAAPTSGTVSGTAGGMGGGYGTPTYAVPPDWATAVGITPEQYAYLGQMLGSYNVFDYGGVTPYVYHGTTSVNVPTQGDMSVPYTITAHPNVGNIESYYNQTPFDLTGYMSHILSPTELAAGVTPESVQTLDEQARANALDQLLNGAVPFAGTTAGTAPTSAANFNYDQAIADIQAQDQVANQQAYADWLASAAGQQYIQYLKNQAIKSIQDQYSNPGSGHTVLVPL